jgi:glycosyltransferase involved in cell wall biosynthesis
MKILQIINSLSGGGAEKLAVQFHQNFLERGYDSHLLGLTNSCLTGLEKIYSLGCKNPYHFSVLLKLYAFLKQKQWQDLDIIHVHLFPSQLLVPFVINILGLKAFLLTTEHSTFNRRRNTKFGKLVDKYLYSRYTNIICISSGVYNCMSKWQPALTNNLLTIYNGIDIEKYSVTTQLITEKKTLIVISVGRLVEAKNYEIAIRAISKIQALACEYWIVGTGKLEPSLKNLVSSLNLEDKIKFLGYRTDVPELLQQADIFLSTSLWEGFGLSVVEAMAAGIPVVVSNIVGVREIVDEQFQAGFLVDPRSEDTIAYHISQLLEDSELRMLMGKNAQLRASHFNINQTIKEHLNLYIEICKCD